MTEIKKKYQLKIIKPEDEKPSILGRLGKHTSLEGCFLPLVLISLLYVAIKKVFGLVKSKEKADYIEINEHEIICLVGGSLETMKYSEIENMQLHFNSENHIENSDYKEYSKVQFKNKGEKVIFFIDANKMKSRRICTRLYDNRIRFREFKNGKRVFLGKSKNYKEIEELKKKYNLEW